MYVEISVFESTGLTAVANHAKESRQRQATFSMRFREYGGHILATSAHPERKSGAEYTHRFTS